MGDDSAPVAGVYVHLALLPPVPRRIPKSDWVALSDGGGGFEFTRLPVGSYRICVQAPKSSWLNPCQWGLEYPKVTLAASQPSANAQVVLKKGAVLSILLEDPLQLLSQHEGRTRGANLLLGVADDTLGFMPARLISSDPGGKRLEVVVPFNSLRTLVVRTAFFQLVDSSGAILSRKRATMIPLAFAAGQQPGVLRLKVTAAGEP